MEIKLSKGCYSENLTIDGKFIEDMKVPEILEIIQNIAIKHGPDYILTKIVEGIGDEEFDVEACEQCGNYGSDVMLEL